MTAILSSHALAVLSGIPETMLWPLHNRAQEAMRPDRTFDDPVGVRVYRSIDYDYRRNFGAPDGSHAQRAQLFDGAVKDWMIAHPGRPVVELGCGLETQFFRCDDGRVPWIGVDVPPAIAVRTPLLRHPRLRHIADDAFALRWLDTIDPATPILVTAQGLLMYFDEAKAAALVHAVLIRCPKATVLFDVVPRWFSGLTRFGLRKTPHYRSPRMPWGLDGDRIEARVRRWSPVAHRIAAVPYGPTRGGLGAVCRVAARFAGLRRFLGHVVAVQSAGATATTGPEAGSVLRLGPGSARLGPGTRGTHPTCEPSAR